MPDRSSATAESINAARLAIEAQPLLRVAYFGFPLAEPGRLPVDVAWGDVDPDDHTGQTARHHYPAMGVEFTFADGGRVTACWGDAFGHFGLEVWQSGALDVFQNQPHDEDVSDHPWWTNLVGTRLRAQLHWATGYADSTEPVPLVLGLTDPGGSVWLSAAEVLDDGRFLLGLDGVAVSRDPDPEMTAVVAGQ